MKFFSRKKKEKKESNQIKKEVENNQIKKEEKKEKIFRDYRIAFLLVLKKSDTPFKQLPKVLKK